MIRRFLASAIAIGLVGCHAAPAHPVSTSPNAETASDQPVQTAEVVAPRAEPSPIVAEGLTLTVPGANGARVPLLVGADGICADARMEWLYFGPLNGRWVYRVRTADLRDASVSEVALGARVERYAEKPNNGGMSMDDDGNLYLTEVGAGAVGIIPSATRRYRRLAGHPELVWPDSVSFGSDGLLYVSAAQVNRAFEVAPPSARAPFLIFRLRPLARGRLGH